MEIVPDISVIIPIFNVEKYIERCIHSLFNQTKENIEYIFIDDASTDHSINILNNIIKNYPHRRKSVKLITHTYNQGVAASRKEGIKQATGKYIIHCDPDDYISLNMYELLYNKAKLYDADISACNYYINSPSGIKEIKTTYNSNPLELLKIKKFDLGSLYPLWNKLVKREVITKHKIYPIEGCDYGEDFYCMIQILYYSKSLCSIDLPLYYYNKREDSLSNSKMSREQSLNIIKNTILVAEFLEKHNLIKFANLIKINTKINSRKVLNISEKEWINLFRKSHIYVFYLTEIPYHIKLIWFIIFQHFIVYKLVSKFFPSFKLNY